MFGLKVGLEYKILLIQTGILFVNFDLFFIYLFYIGCCGLDLFLKVSILCLKVMDLGLMMLANLLDDSDLLLDNKIVIFDMFLNGGFFLEEGGLLSLKVVVNFFLIVEVPLMFDSVSDVLDKCSKAG
jgi:hypothetical protein